MRFFAFIAIVLTMIAPVATASSAGVYSEMVVMMLGMLPSGELHPGVAFLGAALMGMLMLGRARA